MQVGETAGLSFTVVEVRHFSVEYSFGLMTMSAIVFRYKAVRDLRRHERDAHCENSREDYTRGRLPPRPIEARYALQHDSIHDFIGSVSGVDGDPVWLASTLATTYGGLFRVLVRTSRRYIPKIPVQNRLADPSRSTVRIVDVQPRTRGSPLTTFHATYTK